MKYFIIIIFLISLLLPLQAQELSIRKVELLSTDSYASVNRRNDANGDPCAVVKVSFTVSDAIFDGNIVGPILRDAANYIIYMTPGSKTLRIKHPSFHELDVSFLDYGISSLKGLATYRIIVEKLSDANNVSPLTPLTFKVKGVSFTMMPVEGGTFTMGATPEMTNPSDNEKPSHQVTLTSYYIGETEVTQELWNAVMGSNPSFFKGKKNPVENINWEDCMAFIFRLNQMTGKNFRLPTEAEWEFAARGGNKSIHMQYSGSNSIDEVAWYEKNSKRMTHPVKMKKANEIGIYDMSGNVSERCQDRFENYCNKTEGKSSGDISTTIHYVIRGASWGNVAWSCRSSNRGSGTKETRGNSLGIRLAL